MRYAKTLVTVAAADILALFISMTLAFSSGFVLKVISAVCTASVLICVLGSFAVKQAEKDVKSGKNRILTAVSMGITASLPSSVSWGILKFSALDYYRIHKIVCGYFLQILNFIEPSSSSADLSSAEISAMLPLCIVPAAVVLSAYLFQSKKTDNTK